MAPEFDIFSFPSMLAVHFRPEEGSTSDETYVRPGEGPHRILTEETGPWEQASDTVQRAEVALHAVVNTPDLEKLQDDMQEHTLALLRELLDRAGVSREERLVIVVDEGGGVDVAEHPQRELALSVLAEHPQLREKLRAMAAGALLARGMDDISRANHVLREHGGEGGKIFQACLKGSLSHCHLVREGPRR